MSKPIKIVKSLMLIAIHLAACMLGYSLIEKWDPLPAFHAAVRTLLPFIYGEKLELSQAGFHFGIAMKLFALGILVYIISSMASFMMEGRIKSYLKVGQMDTKISGLKDHYIICGAGEISRYIMEEFMASDIPFIVIDKNQKIVDELTGMGISAVKGDSADNEILKSAGIEQAAGVLAVHTTDAENILAVLSSRQLNPDIRIVAGAIDNVNQPKYLFCGADAAIPICELSGRRIAAAALHPSVSSFFEVDGKLNESMSASVVEVELEEGSYLVGRSQSSSNIRSKTGATILCLIRDDEVLVNPGLNEVFHMKDRLLVFGTNAQISEFKKLACPGEPGDKKVSRPEKTSQETPDRDARPKRKKTAAEPVKTGTEDENAGEVQGKAEPETKGTGKKKAGDKKKPAAPGAGNTTAETNSAAESSEEAVAEKRAPEEDKETEKEGFLSRLFGNSRRYSKEGKSTAKSLKEDKNTAKSLKEENSTAKRLKEEKKKRKKPETESGTTSNEAYEVLREISEALNRMPEEEDIDARNEGDEAR
ncbi:MAG: hypothetical protein GXX04_08085 [Clostridiaceae bacterium]|nr:hypothetical protein [Clostridiaceae bacterium]